MKRSYIFAALFAAAFVSPTVAQVSKSQALGEIIVTGNRINAGYAQENRPVVGLRREADSAVMTVSFSSDSRDEATRKKEIHTMLLAAMDRAGAAGVELVTGNFELIPVTKANYQELPFNWAGRVDTSKVDVMVKVKLAGSTVSASSRIDSFVKGLPRNGRGAIDKAGGLVLTIVNPDQYRDAIVKLVAEDARSRTTIFGPDYAVQVTGIDGQIFWSQVSGTDVFLYIPYRYTIVPK
ncbi:hypothetical protein [Sphingorhabdus sp.]|uniref:hypothetical protein n=1 Tax=Sphingorhabdus sp. TaxID=1902408 RepID=UPI003BB121C1